MKATHNITRSERKQHRVNLHENDIHNVNIQLISITEKIFIFILKL